jgi:hypothetical protein
MIKGGDDMARRPGLAEQLHDYAVIQDVAADARETRKEFRRLDARVEELEVVVRAALSFVQGRHMDHNDGHAQMVIAAMRGALAKRERD